MINMDSEKVFLSKLDKLNNKLIDLSDENNFLNFVWSNSTIPIIDVDFFELFSNFVIKKEGYELSSELSIDEIEKLLENDSEDKSKIINLKKTQKRIELFQNSDKIDEYYSQNTLALFKNPKYYINRNDDFVFNSPIDNKDLMERINLIDLKNKFNISENGILNLYLVLGFLSYENKKSPLIFIPSTLKKINDKYEVYFNDSNEIKLNKTLEIYLKQKDINLPDSEIQNEMDLINYLTNINQSISKIGELKPMVALGLFDFADIDMSEDLNLSNWSDNSKSELNMLLSDSTNNVEPIITEDKINLMKDDLNYNVYNADSSQLLAIEEAKLEDNILIDAPDNCGKYETITNMIVNIIANQKTVLFVSQKIAALKNIEDKLSNIEFDKLYLNLYANNFNNESFIAEIDKTISYDFNLNFNQEFYDSKIKELTDLKFNLDEYDNFIHNPYKDTNFSPYYLFVLKEDNLKNIEKSGFDLKLIEMNNLSNLNSNEINNIFSKIKQLNGFFINNISPTMKHKFNQVTSIDVNDKEFLKIINSIPNLKNAVSDLNKLIDELNNAYGVKKLDVLQNHDIYIDNINILKNNPNVMGNDEKTLKYYIECLNKFQIKTNEFGSISDLEKFLSVEMYNTKNDLRTQMEKLESLNTSINNFNNLLSNFRNQLSDSGIKTLNSIEEIESSISKFNLLNKNPSIVKNEKELDAFIQDIEEFQKEFNKNSPTNLLETINNNAKNALKTTFEKINTLISYKNNIQFLYDSISKILELKNEIGLKNLNSVEDIKFVLNKSDILLKRPMLIDKEDDLETFYKEFEKGHKKFSKLSYENYYNFINDEVIKIQDNIISDLSDLSILESNLPIIIKELNNLERNYQSLSQKILFKKIASLNQIDESIDNLEILLENPIIIKKEDKSKVDSFIQLIDDVQNEKDYIKLNIRDVKKAMQDVKDLEHQLDELNFDYSIINVDLVNSSNLFLDTYQELYASPIYNAMFDKQIERKFNEFKESKDKLLKIFNTDYGKLKSELKSKYSIKAPNDDEIIIKDYTEFFKIYNKFQLQKQKILTYYNGNGSDFNDEEFSKILNKLKDLKLRYVEKFKIVDNYLPFVPFEKRLEQLVLVKLKLDAIENISDMDNKLNLYFPKSYIGFSTDLNDLYDEYVINETFKKLVEEKFFKKDVMSNFNSNELKNIIMDIKQSKSKIIYYLSSINYNIDLKDSLLSFNKIFNITFKELSDYCNELVKEIKESNNLFNEFLDKKEIKDIAVIIEDFTKLNSLKHIKTYVNVAKYEIPLKDCEKEFNALNDYNDMGKNYKFIIDKYYSRLWNGTKTSLTDLSNQYDVYKEFTKLYEENFFSDNVLLFLNDSEGIKNKLNSLKDLCNKFSQKIFMISDELVFYNDDLSKLHFIPFNNQNKFILSEITILEKYNKNLLKYDFNNLIDNYQNSHSIDVINRLYDDLNKIYNDKKLSSFKISFEIEIKNLNEINDSKTKYLEIISLKDSINQRKNIINNHFIHENDKFNIWNGPLSSLKRLNKKIWVDKEFTKLYNEKFYNEKTLNLIKNDVFHFKNFESEITDIIQKFNDLINDLNNYSILENYSKESSFKDINNDILKIQSNLNQIKEDYSNITLNKTFDMSQTLDNINLFDKIITSDLIKSLNLELNILNKHNLELKTHSNMLIELNELKNKFDNIQIDSKYFYTIWNGYDTKIDDLNNQFSINQRYAKLFDNKFFTDKINIIFEDSNKYNEFFKKVDDINSLINNIIGYFKSFDLINNQKKVYLTKNIEDLSPYINFYNDNIEDLENWRTFEKYCSDLNNDCAREFINNLRKDNLDNDVILDTFYYNFANNLLNEIKRENNILNSFDEDDIGNFKKLCDDIIYLNKNRVLEELKKSKPIFDRSIKNSNELTNQYKAYSSFINKRNDESIKNILNNSIDYIKTIKPIFIMNPFSVIQYLNSSKFESYFDYIIFDDINSCNIENSITTLLRAKNKIIIGESGKSNSFSIFNLCKSKFKNMYLKWYNKPINYSLIELVNKEIYGNNLLLYPSSNLNNKCYFKLNYLKDSAYISDDDNNPIEAEKIVKYAINHVEKYGFDKSLGIITLNKSQKNLIIDVLKKYLDKNPELIKFFNPLKSFFIKEINEVYENCDVLLVSLIYGFDKENKFNINNDIDKKDLKVLISNSNEKTILFSNFNSKELRENIDDVDKFRFLNTMLFIFEKSEINETNNSQLLSLFENSVYEFIKDNGFEVKKQLGYNNYIDMVILNKDNPNNSIAIECDSDNYNKFKLTKDRVKLHISLLEKMGWNYCHVYSNKWDNSRQEYQNTLLEKIKEIFENNQFSDLDEFEIDVDDTIGLDNSIEIHLEDELINDYILTSDNLAELLRM